MQAQPGCSQRCNTSGSGLPQQLGQHKVTQIWTLGRCPWANTLGSETFLPRLQCANVMNTAAGPMLSKEPGYKQESFAHHITGCALNIPWHLWHQWFPHVLRPKAFVGPMTTEMPAAGLTFCITEVRAGEHSLDLLGLGLRGTTTINQPRTKGKSTWRGTLDMIYMFFGNYQTVQKQPLMNL